MMTNLLLIPIQKHTDCGYGYKVVCCYDNTFSKPLKVYRGEKAVYKFTEEMIEEIEYCKQAIETQFNKPLKMTEADEKEFQKADRFHICDNKYTEEDTRVGDHCHITGKYRGSAHQRCNINFRLTDKMPVVFHNLRGYDSHFIMKEIGEIVKNYTCINGKGLDINVIPNNMEKYIIAFMIEKNLVFIDSFKFMNQSLSTLVNNLPADTFKYIHEVFRKKEKRELMKRKGVYPYDWMDSFNKFSESLPAKEDFYSMMNDEHISDEDSQHAQNVWSTFKLENMGDYHDLYLGSDVLLSADVFENFRKTCQEYYKLDPCHYFTMQSWT